MRSTWIAIGLAASLLAACKSSTDEASSGELLDAPLREAVVRTGRYISETLPRKELNIQSVTSDFSSSSTTLVIDSGGSSSTYACTNHALCRNVAGAESPFARIQDVTILRSRGVVTSEAIAVYNKNLPGFLMERYVHESSRDGLALDGLKVKAGKYLDATYHVEVADAPPVLRVNADIDLKNASPDDVFDVTLGPKGHPTLIPGRYTCLPLSLKCVRTDTASGEIYVFDLYPPTVSKYIDRLKFGNASSGVGVVLNHCESLNDPTIPFDFCHL